MTNEAAPPFSPAPTSGYWYLQLNPVGQAKAFKDGNKRVAEEFTMQVQKGVEAITKAETDPEKLRMGYRNKPVSLWVGQRVYFPRMFEAAWDKWTRVDPSPEARRLRDATLAEVSAQAEALQRQIALQEAQARAPAPPPVMASGGPEAVGPGAGPPPPAPAPMA